MSRTENSSKHSSDASRASFVAIGAIGSSPLVSPRLRAWRHSMQARVHVGHEGVEMGATLAMHEGGVEEHVHQHRLAAPDRAVEIEAARRFGGFEADEARERAWLPLGAVIHEAGAQRVQPVGELGLRRVVDETAIENERPIAPGDGGHALFDCRVRGLGKSKLNPSTSGRCRYPASCSSLLRIKTGDCSYRGCLGGANDFGG